MSEDKPVLCEINEGIAVITLNRPQRMNAYNRQMGIELNATLKRCGEDDSVRAIVVTGAGRAYCAGADLEKGGDTFDGADREQQIAEDRKNRVAPWDIHKPIIAAINGHAVGVGLTMPLQYDMRIAASEAKLGFAFVQRGILPELASTWIVPRLIGIARACDLMMTGRIFRGLEAAEMGLVNEAVPADQVLKRAREIARYIATKCAPVSVALTKRMIWEHLRIGDPDVASRREGSVLYKLGAGPDAREGVTAFLEKRDARWTMRPSVDTPKLEPIG